MRAGGKQGTHTSEERRIPPESQEAAIPQTLTCLGLKGEASSPVGVSGGQQGTREEVRTLSA